MGTGTAQSSLAWRARRQLCPRWAPCCTCHPERARSAAILLLFRRTARAAAILTRGVRWSRAVIVLRLSLRPGNRHHNAVGVAAEFRAGWTIARVSAGVVAADRRPARCSRGQGRPGIWLCGFSPLLTAGVTSFPDRRKLSAAGGRRRPAWPPGLGVLLVALRPGPVGNHPVRDSPRGLPLPRWWFDAVSSAASRPFARWVLSAMNCDARVFMTDFEDGSTLMSGNLVIGHRNLRNALQRETAPRACAGGNRGPGCGRAANGHLNPARGAGFRWQRRWSASGELMPADGSSGLPAPG